MAFWMYPDSRYYEGWYDAPPPPPTDGAVKSMVVDRLRENTWTAPYEIRVDVKQRVVVLGGVVGTSVAKRSAGDDAWDTPGVVDVSNQLVVDAA